MQTSQQISLDQLQEIVSAVFDQGPVIVREAYSGYGCGIIEFSDSKTLLGNMHNEQGIRDFFRQYVLYYPEAKGYTYERRIALNPEACNGHTFRFCQEGWGLIQLQCDFRERPMVVCRIAVNSPSRAELWSDTLPDLQNADAWDWEVVQQKAGRLVRLLRRFGNSNQTNR